MPQLWHLNKLVKHSDRYGVMMTNLTHLHQLGIADCDRLKGEKFNPTHLCM